MIINPARFLAEGLAVAAGEEDRMKLNIMQRLALLSEKCRSYVEFKHDRNPTGDRLIIAALTTVIFLLFLLAAYVITRF